MKVGIIIDDIRLKSNLKNNKTLFFTKNFFLWNIWIYSIIFKSFERNWGVFIQLIPGLYKSDKHFNITGVDKNNLKCDCINGSIVDGVRQPIIYSFALCSLPGH